MNKLLTSLICLACSPLALAQQTWTVGAGGSLPAAIAQAQPGDTILVMPGTYPADFVIDKGIQVIGQGAELASAPFSLTGARIENVPAGQTCVFAGFSAGVGPLGGDVSLAVTDCAGSVLLRGLSQSGLELWSVGIQNSAQVCVAEAVVRSLNTRGSNVVCENIVFDPELVAGLWVDGGRTVVVGCSVNGGPVFGGPGIWLVGGELAITRSTVTASASNAPAIFSGGGVVVVDPSVTLFAAGGQTITGPATVVQTGFYSITSRYDGATGTMHLENHGATSEPFVTVMSLPSAQLATPLGVAWVDATSIVVVAASVYGQNRFHNAALPLPPLPPGLSVALQSVVFPSAGFGLSTPSLLTIE